MSQVENKTEDTIDLKELFFSLLAQWKLIALCVLVSLIFAILYLRVTPDTYSVDALVQVEDSKGASAALLGDLSKVIEQKSPAQSEIEILKSRLILGKVIKDLNLDIQIESHNDTLKNRLLSQPTFQTLYFTDHVRFIDDQYSFDVLNFQVPDSLRGQNFILQLDGNKIFLRHEKTGDSFKGQTNQLNRWSTPDGTIELKIKTTTNIDGQYNLSKISLRQGVSNLANDYNVAEKGKLTGIIGLNYQGQDKAHITQVLNEILSAYTQQNITRRTAETEQTLKFLEQQLPELKNELEASERLFNDFRQRNSTIDVAKESELLLAQSIGFETKKVELQQQQAELAARYTADHPLMAEVNAQLSSIEERLSSLNNNLRRLPEVQRQYLQLFRDVQVNTELYTSLLNNYQQLKVAKAGEIGNVRVIDDAVEPIKPIKPKKLIVLILSIFAGGFIGVVLALLRNMMRTGVKDTTQVEQAFDLPVYATIPRSPFQPVSSRKKSRLPLLAHTHADDISIESLRSVRTALHFSLTKAKNKVILITGPAPEVGKSFVSANLAVVLSQNNKKVLLVDGDMRRGYLHKYMNQKNQPGLAELITGAVSVGEAVQVTKQKGLDFIPRGKSPSNPAELLNSEQFQSLLELLSSQYDHIVIDSPPILAVTDGIIISQYAGVNLIVARYAQTQIRELEMCVNRFEQAGSHINGFILNDVQRSGDGAYGYGYGYSYVYKYQSKAQDD